MQPGAREPTFSLAREELRRAWREMRGPGTTPLCVAASLGAGVLVGCVPSLAVRALLAVVVSIWLQLDVLLSVPAAVAAWPLARQAAALVPSFGLLPRVALAPLVLVVALGVVTGSVAVLPRVKRTRPPYELPNHAPSWLKAVEEVAARCADPSSPRAWERTYFHYLRSKLLVDPVPRLIAGIARERPQGLGRVLDVGTGRGQLPLLLLELGLASSVRGIDWDETKIAAASRAAPPRAEFACIDVRDADFGVADTVLLIDVLHYVGVEEQNALLDRAANAVSAGGVLLVREADAGKGLRTWATLVEERVWTRLRFNLGERVRFRPSREIVARLEAMGFVCEVRAAWGSTPFSNVLVIARRQPS